MSKEKMDSTKYGDSSNPNIFGTKEALFSTFMKLNIMVE
jgi:hypothetical protein